LPDLNWKAHEFYIPDCLSVRYAILTSDKMIRDKLLHYLLMQDFFDKLYDEIGMGSNQRTSQLDFLFYSDQ